MMSIDLHIGLPYGARVTYTVNLDIYINPYCRYTRGFQIHIV